jgi:hypothetical protein
MDAKYGSVGNMGHFVVGLVKWKKNGSVVLL